MTVTPTTASFVLQDQWFGDGDIQITAFYSESTGTWYVSQAIQNGWDITHQIVERLKYNLEFRATFVAACEGAK